VNHRPVVFLHQDVEATFLTGSQAQHQRCVALRIHCRMRSYPMVRIHLRPQRQCRSQGRVVQDHGRHTLSNTGGVRRLRFLRWIGFRFSARPATLSGGATTRSGSFVHGECQPGSGTRPGPAGRGKCRLTQRAPETHAPCPGLGSFACAADRSEAPAHR
jgi:hypothetical protein